MNIPGRTIEVSIPSKKGFDLEEDVVEKKQPKWKQVHGVKGTIPSPRSGHSAVCGNNHMYVFGGRDGNTFKSDLMEYDFSTRTWAEVATKGHRPTPRYGHKALVHNNNMVVFGGHASTTYLNDLLILDLDTKVWEKVEPQGQVPSPRWQHSMVVWQGMLIVFGGCDSASYLNDLYLYDFERNHWQTITVDDYSIPPTPRMMHGAIICAERMLIFGGQCVDSIRNDFFEFNFELRSWNYIGVAEGRFRRNFPCLEIGGNFLLFGGYSVGLHNDVLRFDFDTGTWETVEIQGKVPSARSGHTGVVYEERIYFFGGVSNEGAQNDLHVLSLGYLNESSANFGSRVGSYNEPEGVNSPLKWNDPLMGTSPMELNFLQRVKSSSSIGSDREILALHNKDEGPLIHLFREEIHKLKEELEEYRRENFELKRELAAIKSERQEEHSDVLLY